MGRVDRAQISLQESTMETRKRKLFIMHEVGRKLDLDEAIFEVRKDENRFKFSYFFPCFSLIKT